jgi:hypothetical protein
MQWTWLSRGLAVVGAIGILFAIVRISIRLSRFADRLSDYLRDLYSRLVNIVVLLEHIAHLLRELNEKQRKEPDQ